MILDLARFAQSGRPQWQALEQMLTSLENNPQQQLPVAELTRFHSLYQRACSDLVRLEPFSPDSELRVYLETLVSRAYGEMQESASRGRFRPWHWLAVTFPVTFRRRAMAFQLAVLLTIAGCAFGALALSMDKEAKSVIMPFSHLSGSPAQRVAEEERGRGKDLTGKKGSFAAQLMQNNIKVSITAMALGMSYGIGTIIVLFYNGVILGAVAFDYITAGYTTFLLGWLLPHGATEIPAILLGGQAGLVIAHALIGWGSRENLRERMRGVAPDVVTIIGGAALLLVWAGIVEAFFSQYHSPVLPYSVKIAFGSLELFLLTLYLRFAGRQIGT